MIFPCLSPTRPARGCKVHVKWKRAWAPATGIGFAQYLNIFFTCILHTQLTKAHNNQKRLVQYCQHERHAIRFQLVEGMWCGWLERGVITSYVVVLERLYWQARASRSFEIPRVSMGCVINCVFHWFLFRRYLLQRYRSGAKKIANPKSLLLCESLPHKMKP